MKNDKSKDSSADFRQPNWEAVGCIGSFVIFTILSILLTGSGRVSLLIPMLIGSWLATRMYRRNMEKRLGRKVREDHETTYEEIALWELAYELPFTDKCETEAKIKRELSAKQLGKYDQERIDLLRRFNDDIQTELFKGQKSKYYIGPHRRVADRKDFDGEWMEKDFAAAFPSIPKRAIARFIEFAIYLYYLR